MSRLLNLCPDIVLEDVATHGYVALASHFDKMLTLAADQPLAFDALGCEIALCGCGQLTWLKGADRWELMTGAPHRHPRTNNDLPYHAMVEIWDRAPAPHPPWQSSYGSELA